MFHYTPHCESSKGLTMKTFIPCIALLSIPLASAHAQTLRAVALTGDPAPGTTSTFSTGYNNPVLNNSGRVAFQASLTMAGLNGVWSDANGSLSPVVLSGAFVPGNPAATIPTLVGVKVFLSDDSGGGMGQGNVGFIVSTTGGLAVLAQENGVLSTAARDGGPAPGNPPGHFVISNGSADPVLNAHGRLAFRASYNSTSPPSSLSAIWSGTPSGLTMGARTEFGVPLPPGFGGFGDPLFSDAGSFCVLSSFRNDSGTRPGIFSGPPLALNPVALFQQPAPGFPNGATFSQAFGSPQGINSSNTVVFTIQLQGGGVTGNDDWTFWAYSPSGSLQLLVREGDQVPGLPAGVVISDGNASQRTPVISDSGHVAFTAPIRGPGVTSDNNQAVFLKYPGSGGRLRMIARTGTQAPGYPTGSTIITLSSPALNAVGQIAFFAQVFGVVSGSPVYATDTAGRLTLIAEQFRAHTVRPGLTIRVGPPGVFFQTGGSDARQRNFNDAGEYAFTSSWVTTNGQQSGNGIFVARTPCAADWNLDGFVNSQDFFDFLGAFFAGTGDFNNDLASNSQDFFDFLSAFFAGC